MNQGLRGHMSVGRCTYILTVMWENLPFAYAKSKAHISCTVTAQLISAFAYTT